MKNSTYQSKRNMLLNEAKVMVNNNALQDAENKLLEVEILDKAYNLSQDNVYTMAFSKQIHGDALTDAEAMSFKLVNESFRKKYKLSEDIVLLPESISNKIWERIKLKHPIFRDIKFMNSSNKIAIVGDSHKDEEGEWGDTSAAAESNLNVKSIELDGCELFKLITISWKLYKTNEEDFINYIVDRFSIKLGNSSVKAVIYGAGKENPQEAPQPKGIIVAAKEEINTPQIVTYTSLINEADFTNAISKLSNYHKNNSKVYANKNTIWNNIAKIQDTNNINLFIPDPNEEKIGKILGYKVEEESSLKDGDVIIGNAYEGYTLNVREEISTNFKQHIKARTTDLMMYALVDGDVLDNKAFAILEKNI